MPRPDRVLPALAIVMLLAASCASGPDVTGTPGATPAGPSATPTDAPSKPPFHPGQWPTAGSACDLPGYSGRLGRIEAVDARTIRFTLCAPDGAFPARIADPSLAVFPAPAIARLATDPASARSLAGTGPYRIARWEPGSDVILEAAAAGPTAASQTPTLVLRWAADPARRATELQAAAVDGIDAPGQAEIDRIDTQPELVVVPRAGLATAYLAFGSGAAFSTARVRRDIATGFDRSAVVARAFPSGSTVPTHLVPCAIAGACGGADWGAANGPAAAADLAAAGFDLTATVAIHVPDQPLPGLPDPVAAATAVGAGLRAGIGLATSVDVMPAASFASSVAAGTLDGLYLDDVSPGVADPGAYLGALFGPGATATPATRVTGVREALATAAATADAATRAAAFGAANGAIRDAAPVVPLAIAGSTAAYRADVAHVVASPLGIDPLGAFVPGDRHQLVFMQATEPAGAWCGDTRSADVLRLCALVSDPLYGFAPGTLAVEPRLAQRCSPNPGATVWTCVLRAGVQFTDGTLLDAADVLATYVAQWDAGGPLHRARPDATFEGWRALFGGFLGSTGS